MKYIKSDKNILILVSKLILIIHVILLFLTPVYAQSSNTVFSGVFTYKISGSVETGSEVFSFNKDKSRRLKTLTLIADGSITKTLEINDGNAFYIINLNQKTGFKVPHPAIILEKDKPQNVSQERKKIMKSFFDTLTPIREYLSTDKANTTTFFGKSCKVLKGSIFKTYLWKSHILRQEITFPFTKIKEVIDMKINVKVPDSMFIPPSDIEYSSLNTQKLKNLLNSLKAKYQNETNSKKE